MFQSSDVGFNFLERINYPSDLKKLALDDLVILSDELRRFIIDAVSENPGHLGASLGVVELTVALHYVFSTPADTIIWDVGHQAYGHKILTGRRELFHTNRRYKGLSGFPKLIESPHDCFGVGHSSTSISAALGMAVASRLNKDRESQFVAVIGDGSMTGGLAFEGLNNAGIQNSNLLVILNDNNIAIDPNVGALKEYLLDITTSQTYNKIKEEVWHMLGKVSKLGPRAREAVQKIEGGLKTALLKHSNLFEALNFRYFGPADGHDVVSLARILRDLKQIPGPKILHVRTVKGKGFPNAEKFQTLWHAPGLFDKKTGEFLSIKSDKPSPPRYQDVFGHTILELAEKNEKIVGITPAMPTGCSLNIMMEKMPDRTFDVGIAEQHAVTFSAGLAVKGMLPFCNIYSSFIQRAYDQVIHDVALQNLNVIFCLDRGGLAGSDGATHHGFFDIAYMRTIPNMTVSAPMNEEELRNLMYTAQMKNMGPFAIRYPRGNGVMAEWRKPFRKIPVGKGRKLRDGTDLAILSLGHPGNFAASACVKLDQENIHAAHFDMRFAKPLDEELLHYVFKKFKQIITVEDGMVTGGFGTAVLEFMADNNYQARVIRLGIPDRFIDQGTLRELYAECGFDEEGIIATARKMAKKLILSSTG
jgi:1-deoxy-D-xylulose-5-phosphate synthase